MQLTIFGATGRIGAHVVGQALQAGHDVTAVVRDGSPFVLRHPRLEVVSVPRLDDPRPLAPAVAGRDAAISAVGPRRRRDAGVAAPATRGILGALEAAGLRRFLAVSAVPVGRSPVGDSFANRRILFPLIRAVLRDVYADLAEMEHDIAMSATDWTVIRPPYLTDRPLTGAYRIAIGGNVPRGRSIGRAEVAHALLAMLDDPATIKQAVGLAV